MVYYSLVVNVFLRSLQYVANMFFLCKDILPLVIFFQTDYKLLEFTFKTKVDRLKSISRHVYNFKKAIFDKIRAELNCVDFSEVHNAIDVNSSWSYFTHIFVSILDRNIPQVKVKDSTSPAWIDSEVRHI